MVLGDGRNPAAAKIRRSYGNLVWMHPFYGDPADRELPRLSRYLRQLSPDPNVRRLEKRGWQRWTEDAVG